MSLDPDRPLNFDATLFNLHCEHCGYPLRGLSQPRCPECGGAIDLSRHLRLFTQDVSASLFSTHVLVSVLGFLCGIVWRMGVVGAIPSIRLALAWSIFVAASCLALGIGLVRSRLNERKVMLRVRGRRASRLPAMALLLSFTLVFFMSFFWIELLVLIFGLIASRLFR